jgi:hypothetical protein
MADTMNEYRDFYKSLQPANRNLKDLLDEYRTHVKAIEFSDRTPEAMADWEEWQQTNAEHLASLGIDSGQLFDQLYEELEHLFYPRAEHRETIHQWHRDHSAQLLAQGLYSYEEVFYAVDDLKETYRNSDSNGLRESLTKLASIPLMTTEVMQEIIYEACRDLPAGAVIGLNKVKISAP